MHDYTFSSIPKEDQLFGVLDAIVTHEIETFEHTFGEWVVMASYAHYIHQVDVVSDHLYDQMTCRVLIDSVMEPLVFEKPFFIRDLSLGQMSRWQEKDYPEELKAHVAHIALNVLEISLPYVVGGDNFSVTMPMEAMSVRHLDPDRTGLCFST